MLSVERTIFIIIIITIIFTEKTEQGAETPLLLGTL